MARVRSLEREDLPAEHRHIYDDIARSRGRVQPNFKALLNNPLATARMAALGGYVRFEAPLPPRVKMLAVLATARENEGDYVWTANLPQARDAGIDEATIQAIRERRALQGLAPEDAAIVQFTLNQPTRDSYTHAASLACASRAICSTAAVTSGS
jgi:4-carboxymuconolactone decarboxylase